MYKLHNIFSLLKFYVYQKRKKNGKHWILLLYSKYRFEFSCGAKFAGSEKCIEWKINKKSRVAKIGSRRRKRKRRDRISKNSTDRMIMTREYVHIVNCIPLRLTGIKSLLQCYSLWTFSTAFYKKPLSGKTMYRSSSSFFFLPPILPLAAGETTRLSSFNRNR